MEEITLSQKETLLSSYIFRVRGFESGEQGKRGEYRLILGIKSSKIPNLILEKVFIDSFGKRVSLLDMGRVINPKTEKFEEEIRGWYSQPDKTSHYFIKPLDKNEAISLCGRLRLSQFSPHDLEETPENGKRSCRRCKKLLEDHLLAQGLKEKKKENELR